MVALEIQACPINEKLHTPTYQFMRPPTAFSERLFTNIFQPTILTQLSVPVAAQAPASFS